MKVFLLLKCCILFTCNDALRELVKDLQALVVVAIQRAQLEQGVVHEPRYNLSLLDDVHHRLYGLGVAVGRRSFQLKVPRYLSKIAA